MAKIAEFEKSLDELNASHAEHIAELTVDAEEVKLLVLEKTAVADVCYRL